MKTKIFCAFHAKTLLAFIRPLIFVNRLLKLFIHLQLNVKSGNPSEKFFSMYW